MSENNWLEVPIGLDADRWVTRDGCRKVLVITHTVVSAQRLVDVVDLIESDERVQVVYTRAEDVFSGGVKEYLRSIGALEMPWQQAIRERFDLALAAAYGGIGQVHAPVMVLPHGAGYAKRSRRAAGGRPVDRAVYGLGAEHLIQAGRVVPASVVLSHEAQRDVLARQCPPAVEVALVAGDPCYDRLRASAGRRAQYRDALGISPGRQLVLVASTWGPRSLFNRHRDLVATLLRQLDPRYFRIAAMFHPAVWFGHGRRQLRAWLADERAAGLILIEPDDDWRGVVVAADHVIGDHGSATVYAAAAGKPVLHTDLPSSELDEQSVQVFLGSRVPRLLTSQPIEPQLRHAVRTLPRDWAAEVAERLTSRPGQAHRLLREAMYRLLGLDLPGKHRAVEPAPLPRITQEYRDV